MFRLLVITFSISVVALAQECRKATTPTDECTGCVTNVLTEEEKVEILKFHKYVRDKIRKGEEDKGNPGPQKKALPFKDLNWSRDLASKALEYVNQCPDDGKLDPCRSTSDFGQNVGKFENNDTTPETKLDIRHILNRWYSGVEHLNKSEIHSYQEQNSTNVGEYTQMVWSLSTEIGCAVLKRTLNETRAVHLVCNYQEPGNIVGKPVYLVADEKDDDHERSGANNRTALGIFSYLREKRSVNTLDANLLVQAPMDIPMSAPKPEFSYEYLRYLWLTFCKNVTDCMASFFQRMQ